MSIHTYLFKGYVEPNLIAPIATRYGGQPPLVSAVRTSGTRRGRGPRDPEDTQTGRAGGRMRTRGAPGRWEELRVAGPQQQGEGQDPRAKFSQSGVGLNAIFPLLLGWLESV